ncbi:hypothetical protein FXV77_20725 [Sphingobacterium phlebotomi]|uniref:Uncharacterized protein n=1 Tax=Sphingobacterium phlebotomi TaxID=2605433 RepID=A0A5D4GYS5_9SPHI|nr:hypothetical protein [Sphingobacterium phlebotomi]TYR31670.1 hypothetical protein FXV77_20725 [Sphingobacterium phlebotomi]
MMFNFFKRNDKNKATPRKEDLDREAIQKRGLELAEVTKKRHAAGFPQQAKSQEDLTAVMYVFTDRWDYAIMKLGIDVPLLDDGSLRPSLRKKGFLPLNESVYIHVSQIRSVDLEALQIEIDPELDRNMRRNLRGDDVMEKLQRCREKDSDIFDIDRAFAEEIRAIIER